MHIYKQGTEVHSSRSPSLLRLVRYITESSNAWSDRLMAVRHVLEEWKIFQAMVPKTTANLVRNLFDAP